MRCVHYSRLVALSCSYVILQTEVEQLRKRLSDVEMKHARQVHDLNKEITELETLVEAKVSSAVLIAGVYYLYVDLAHS